MSKTLNEIIDEVCEKMSIDRGELLRPGRTQDCVKARRLVCRLAFSQGFSIPQIASSLGRKADNVRYLLSDYKRCAPAMGGFEVKCRVAYAMSDGRVRNARDISKISGCTPKAAEYWSNKLVDDGLLDKDSGMRPVIFKKSEMNNLVQVDEAARRAAKVFIQGMGA